MNPAMRTLLVHHATSNDFGQDIINHQKNLAALRASHFFTGQRIFYRAMHPAMRTIYFHLQPPRSWLLTWIKLRYVKSKTGILLKCSTNI